MKLVSFSVRRYRSITDASKLPIRDGITVLIGPNNEGKSNVLRALVTALDIASGLGSATLGRHGRFRSLRRSESAYDWTTDFPIGLKDAQPSGESEFDLEFELSATEIADFRREVGSTLNGTLPIRIRIGKDLPSFSVRKQGRAQSALATKAGKIANFIGKRIGYEHIPAVRPAQAATSVVSDLLEREFRVLGRDPAYQAAIQAIERLEAPVLSAISQSVCDTLRVFLPNVRAVQVYGPSDARFRAWSRSCEVIVDDGSPTPLAHKGDGVQSLAALSLMRHASQSSTKGMQLVLAIEEPESHLHPNAVHELRGVLSDIAKEHQVIITTHCPLFVDRRDAGANILVTASKATAAKSIAQIRETMGVRVSDNLVAAEVVLLVEGEDDRRAMLGLLAASSKVLASALKSGVLAVDTMVGSGNLSYKLTQIRESLCDVHCLVDNDASGQLAVARATKYGLLQMPDLTYTTCLGMRESELEDWYDSAMFIPVLAHNFGVPTSSPRYTATNKKWSARIAEVFMSSGKIWDTANEQNAKRLVAEAVAASPSTALLGARRSVFDTLVDSLENKVRRA